MPLPELPEPLPVPVVDTHCHLDTTQVVSGLPAERALDDAAAVNVRRIVQIGCDVAGSRWAVEAARRWPSVVASVAIHPNDAARLGGALGVALTEIGRLVKDSAVRGVGETGLDFYRTRSDTGQEIQREAFAAHIALARVHAKTLVIHDRDAHAAVLEVLDAAGAAERIVMHCFSGDPEFARDCLDRGAYLSFAGTVTFNKNEHLRDALRLCPLDRILVETDAPYLTPMPWRGRPNASYLIPHTVRAMAEVRDLALPDLCRALDANAEAAFGGSWG